MAHHVPRRMPIKVVEIDLAEDGYPDFHAKARTNIPIRIGDAFRSGDEEQGRAAVLTIFPEWDFVDEEGEPIPHTAEGIAALSQDLLKAMMQRWTEAIQQAASIPKASDDGSPPTTPAAPEVPTEAGSLSDTPE